MTFRYYPFTFLVWLLLTLNNHVAHPQSMKFKDLTILDGLSNNTVLKIYQDSYGYMWFGTRDGLNRYDGYEFIIFRSNPYDVHSLSGNHIELIYEDHYRNLFICSESSSLDVYDRQQNRFMGIQEFTNDPSLELHGIVRAMLHDSHNKLWIGSSEGITRYDFDNKYFISFDVNEKQTHPNKLVNEGIYSIIEGPDGLIWIGTYEGLSAYNYQTGTFEHFQEETHTKQGMVDDHILDINILNDSILLLATNNSGLLEMNIRTKTFRRFLGSHSKIQFQTTQKTIKDSSYLWISADDGLFTYHLQSGQLVHHMHDDKDLSTINSDNVLDLFRDNAGTVWISHWHDGLNYYNICENKFDQFKKEPCMNSINNNTVRSITMDRDGDLWLATDQGGINVLNSRTNRYQWFTTNNLRSLPSNVCKDILIDENQNYLVATSKGLIVYAKKRIGNEFHLNNITDQYFAKYVNTNYSGQITRSNVETLYNDYQGNVWIGTTTHLFLLDNERIIRGKINNSQYNPIYTILEDIEGICWIGCLEGLYKYNRRTNEFSIQNHKLTNSKKRIRVYSITEDSKRNLWIGTNGQGLFMLDKDRKPKDLHSLNDNLPNKVINAFIEFGNYMWITTNNGMVKVNLDNYELESEYNYLDGLQSDQFYRNSAFRDPAGRIYVGGVNGYNRFLPQDIVLNTYAPPLFITDIKINNESITRGHNLFGKVLDQHIEHENKITLRHQHTIISFEFRSLNFLTPEKNQYAYHLQGFDEPSSWNYIGTQRNISFTNLEPGDYVLMIKSSNNDGVWNNNHTSLDIQVIPPWWKTTFFKVVVILFALSIIYLLKRWISYNLNLRNAVKVERLEKDKMQEVEEMKLRFFTNISHEFRTPLTLILSPLEKLQQNPKLNNTDKLQLSLMKNNASRLLRLVNQIMDMRKIEAGKLKLEARFGDIVSFIRNIVTTFEPLAHEKSINLVFTAISNQIFTFFDEDKVDKIIFNLLSNAFKYTPDRGTITVRVSIVSSTEIKNNQHDNYVEITVEDNGIGIPKEVQQKIFDRFYQYEDKTHKGQGTGIGLALTKDLVDLHNGSIKLISNTENSFNEKQGTRFIIHLPLLQEEEISSNDHLINELDAEFQPGVIKELPAEKTIILIVEDNSDMRLFIKSHLQEDFYIIEASHGYTGFDQAVEHIPDLILCDVMMPGMDGIELSAKLKKDARTSHIPIVFLTAKASEESKIEGLETGAEDYITKPFNMDVLRQKILNILHSRKILQDKFSKQILLEPTNVKIVSHDEKFIDRAIRIVEKYMDDPDFNIDQFSREVGISKMQLYRKMNALTNQTAKEFIKMIRLKRAAQLLDQNAINVSEVAYAVGFRDLSYFRKCFKKQYGVAPSEYNVR